MEAKSNVAAGNLFGIPLRGIHFHAFVSSFMVGSRLNVHAKIFLVEANISPQISAYFPVILFIFLVFCLKLAACFRRQAHKNQIVPLKWFSKIASLTDFHFLMMCPFIISVYFFWLGTRKIFTFESSFCLEVILLMLLL